MLQLVCSRFGSSAQSAGDPVALAGRRLALALVLTLTLLIAGMTVIGNLLAPHGDTSSGGCWEQAPRCDEVNQIRADLGRQPLQQVHGAQQLAQDWADHLASTGVLIHNPGLAGDTSGLVGENVGYGEDWRAVMAAFENSPPHLKNILDQDYTRVGIGHTEGYGRTWIVLVFR